MIYLSHFRALSNYLIMDHLLRYYATFKFYVVYFEEMNTKTCTWELCTNFPILDTSWNL